jgi:hypothetical protein
MKIPKINLNQEQLKLAFYAVLGILALVFIFQLYKKTGETIGIFDTKEEKEEKERTKKAIDDFKKDIEKKGIKPTRTAAQWALVADSIYNALKFSGVGDDKAKAYTEIIRILNDADAALVVKAFGLRQEYAFGVPIGKPKTLVQFVQDNFNERDINDINRSYSRSGMIFKF